MTDQPQTMHIKKNTTGAIIAAEVHQSIQDTDLLDWQKTWQPEVNEVIQKLGSQGVPSKNWPQSFHWNWINKVRATEGLLGQETFSLRAEGQLQGLMHLDLTKSARHASQSGKPIVYVEYLETAPWNRAPPFRGPLFSGIGSVLTAIAINRSFEEEFKGRIGLHSLPQSEDFYRNTVKMTDLGNDLNYLNLRYFETTPEQAIAFAERK
ncbi:GNAT family N-acetyltransferase [Corallococcus sicarius]|uniref:GNAT family N-acetyltransferase n=1 Tax=Corallococcus sicarius TaxID=2316726 RepID=A0A3A8NRK9_9BACT|nr:GNAT family N-acetyltransferase [Corallococcus sicarius]RKH44811.1 GNAT family N-acetyltransferase [Corallococcus sicarius]